MFSGMKVFCGVFVFGGIATPDVATDHAKPEMNPGVTHLEAFFAAARMGFDVSDLTGMRAGWHLIDSLVLGRLANTTYSIAT